MIVAAVNSQYTFAHTQERCTMGLSTHVLDTLHGTPASGMQGALYATVGERATLIKPFVLGPDGRCPDGMLLKADELARGTYRLEFEVSAYFRGRGVNVEEPAFLGVVRIDFGIAHPGQHYHVPLIVSPWSYTTYRGS